MNKKTWKFLLYSLVLLPSSSLLASPNSINLNSIFSELNSLHDKNSLQRKILLFNEKSSYYEKQTNLFNFFPTLDVTLGQIRREDQTGLPPSSPTLSNPRTQRTLSLSFSQPVYNYTNNLNFKNSKARLKADKLSLKNYNQLSSLQLKNMFLSVITQLYKIETLASSLAKLELYKKNTTVAYKLKERLKSDVDSIAANILLTRSRINIEKQILTENMKNLASFINLPFNKIKKIFSFNAKLLKIEDIESNTNNAIDAKSITNKNITTILRKKSNSYKQIILDSRIQNNNALLESSDLRPQVYIDGTFTKTSEDWSEITDFSNKDKTIGIYISFPLLDTTHYSKRKQTSYLKKAAKSNKISRLRSLKNDLKQLLSRYELQSAQTKILKDHTNTRRDILKHTELSYKYKKITIDDFIIQYNSYYESLLNYTTSLYQQDLLATQIKGLVQI